MRAVLAVALALGLAGPALAARAETLHSLRSVEAAFYRAGIPFSSEWVPTPPNPYLVPKASAPGSSLPSAFRRHLIGWAGRVNATTFNGAQVWVFDGGAPAAEYAGWAWRHCSPSPCTGRILRADNVVYVGSPLPAAARAMAALHRR